MIKMVKTGKMIKMGIEAKWPVWLEKPKMPIFLKQQKMEKFSKWPNGKKAQFGKKIKKDQNG